MLVFARTFSEENLLRHYSHGTVYLSNHVLNTDPSEARSAAQTDRIASAYKKEK
jgi:hypothetical protein